MKFDVCAKDTFEMVLQEGIRTEQLPSVGDYLWLNVDGETEYMVTGISRSFVDVGAEYNTVYVTKKEGGIK